MIGHRIESGATAAGVSLLGRLKLGPVPSIAWVALRRDMPDGALAHDEIEDREDHIPRHDPSTEEKVGHAGGKPHFTSLV